MANAVRDALAEYFDKVVVVDEGKPPGDADLVAVPAFKALLKKNLTLTVLFQPAQTGKKIAELSSTQPFHDDQPGTHAHVWTDPAIGLGVGFIPYAGPFLMFLMVPTVERHDAERFNAGFSPALAASAEDIAMKASKDPAIEALRPRMKTATSK